MSVSVIMPVYNAAKTLESSVRSVLSQTYSDFELLIVDDCSRDESLTIAQKLASEDSRIRILQNEKNMGVVRTLNRAVKEARRPLIARMDADDECMPERLEKQVRYLEQNPSVVLIGSSYQFMGRRPNLDIQVKLPTSSQSIRSVILHENPMCHPVVMFRKTTFDEVGGYRDYFINAEDYDLWLRMSRHHELANIEEPLLRYRLSTTGVTLKRRWEMYIFHHLAIESFKRPEVPLDELKSELMVRFEKEDKRSFLMMIYRDTYQRLWNLGFHLDAARIWFRMLFAGFQES